MVWYLYAEWIYFKFFILMQVINDKPYNYMTFSYTNYCTWLKNCRLFNSNKCSLAISSISDYIFISEWTKSYSEMVHSNGFIIFENNIVLKAPILTISWWISAVNWKGRHWTWKHIPVYFLFCSKESAEIRKLFILILIQQFLYILL